MPRPQWLVEGMFEAKSIVLLAGPPGSYKSFTARDWMLSMATGRAWNGRAVKESKVLYIIGEGKASLLKRIQVWAEFEQLTKTEEEKLLRNFLVTFDVPQMAHRSSVDNLLAGLSEVDFKPEVVVIDTLNRSFVGMDENSQQDCGMWIESAERLRGLGMTVLAVHHTAKNTEFGHKVRGSSVLLGAVDTAIIQVKEAGKRVVLKVDKQKDHDEGKPMYFSPQSRGAMGDTEGSVIMNPIALIDERFAPNHAQMDDMMKQLLTDNSFKTDKERAEILANEFDLAVGTAKTRLSRMRKELGLVEVAE